MYGSVDCFLWYVCFFCFLFCAEFVVVFRFLRWAFLELGFVTRLCSVFCCWVVAYGIRAALLSVFGFRRLDVGVSGFLAYGFRWMTCVFRFFASILLFFFRSVCCHGCACSFFWGGLGVVYR